VLKRAGASLALISEQLGHTSLKTTESYLDSFATQHKRDLSSRLVDFTTVIETQKPIAEKD